MNKEIVMETTHGRASKCKTEFKAVVNKVLVSGVVLATLLGSTGNAYAAVGTGNIKDAGNRAVQETQSYGVSMQETFASIRNTIQAIQDMKAKGSVSDEMIAKLASEVYALQSQYDSSVSLDEVENILNEAENAVNGLVNAEKALTAIVVTRAVLGLGADIREEDYAVQQAKAAPMVSSFPDVTQDKWFYNPVMKATQHGLFAGYDDGEFKPQASMTRGAFITVVARMLELDTTSGSDLWYEQAYLSAVDAGLITKGEMDLSSMEGNISRQEMALVTVRAMEQRGETIGSVNTQNVLNSIPDKAQIGSYYKDFVVKAYSEGILEGDTDGSFRPQGTLTRAEASTVIVKLIDSSERKKKDFSQAVAKPNQGKFDGTSDSDEAIIIQEGAVGQRRFARPGDTVIKADGTRVVLEIVDGILGKNQGVAPDLGVQIDGSGNTTVVASNLNNGRVFSGYTEHKDSTGMSVKNQDYRINQIKGEGHWGNEWKAILSYPEIDGEFADQLSEDKNWIWSASTERWYEVSAQGMSQEVINRVLEANGLN